jgi:hypothetical protein
MNASIGDFKCSSTSFLLNRYGFLGNIALAVLALVVVSLLFTAGFPWLSIGEDFKELIVLVSLAFIMIFGFFLMIATSVIVIKNRSEIIDWGVIWLLFGCCLISGLHFILAGRAFLYCFAIANEEWKYWFQVYSLGKVCK